MSTPLKFRRKPIVVTAIRQPAGTWFVQWPGGDVTLTDEQFRRQFEPTDPDATVGCSCSYDEARRVLPNDHGLTHAKFCPLNNY